MVFSIKPQKCHDKCFPTWSWWSNHCHGFKFQNWWYALPLFRQTHRGWPLVLWPVCRKFSMSAGRPRETTTTRWDRRIKGRATPGIRNRQQTKNPTCPNLKFRHFGSSNTHTHTHMRGSMKVPIKISTWFQDGVHCRWCFLHFALSNFSSHSRFGAVFCKVQHSSPDFTIQKCKP